MPAVWKSTIPPRRETAHCTMSKSKSKQAFVKGVPLGCDESGKITALKTPVKGTCRLGRLSRIEQARMHTAQRTKTWRRLTRSWALHAWLRRCSGMLEEWRKTVETGWPRWTPGCFVSLSDDRVRYRSASDACGDRDGEKKSGEGKKRGAVSATAVKNEGKLSKARDQRTWIASSASISCRRCMLVLMCSETHEA